MHSVEVFVLQLGVDKCKASGNLLPFLTEVWGTHRLPQCGGGGGAPPARQGGGGGGGLIKLIHTHES